MDRWYSVLRLFNQMHLGDFHLLVYRFAHVVNRKQGDGNTDERFHLHPGLGDRPSSAFYLGVMI